MAEEQLTVKDLKLDKRNYNKHNEENKRLIKKSIDECGFGRSVVIDNDGGVICGNGVVSTLDDNTNIKVVETDGNELVVIRRKDLKREDEKRDKLAILDNSTGKLSEWDYDLLKEDFEEDYLNSLGIDVKEEIEDETYTNKINIPQYEPIGLDVDIEDLFNKNKYNELIEEIDKSNLSDNEKEFLKLAATRHIVFDYRNIAEFYTKATKECQELMEKSALIIIDYENAIKNSYTTLNDSIQEVFNEE